MADFAIRTDRLGKRYRRGAEVRGRLIEMLRGGAPFEHFWALRDVSFQVRRGEMFGIIGRNGAGKTTLLRLLSRITRPTEGRALVRGRVGSLLDVGTGFHPELTGRENVYLNGTLIGMRRHEIRRRFDEIVDYSGVEEFLDTPLKHYSRGMRVRLGFAVAVHLRQEIMLVDEVLAVGDAAFREKSLEKMEQLTRSGRTVLFVGHNMEMISSSCDRAIWLDRGSVQAEGPAAEIVQRYQERILEAASSAGGFIDLGPRPAQGGGGPLRLTHLRLLDGRGQALARLESGGRVRLAIGYRAETVLPPGEVSVGITILSRGKVPLAHCESRCAGTDFPTLPPAAEFVCEIDKLPLVPGIYGIALSCRIGCELVHGFSRAGAFQVVDGPFFGTGRMPPPGRGQALIEHRWSLREPASGGGD